MFEKKVTLREERVDLAIKASPAQVIEGIRDALGLHFYQGLDGRVIVQAPDRNPEVGRVWAEQFTIIDGFNAILEALGMEFVLEEQIGTSQRYVKALKAVKRTPAKK